MKAIIMAAGKGTRLAVLGDACESAAHGGGKPLLAYVLDTAYAAIKMTLLFLRATCRKGRAGLSR